MASDAILPSFPNPLTVANPPEPMQDFAYSYSKKALRTESEDSGLVLTREVRSRSLYRARLEFQPIYEPDELGVIESFLMDLAAGGAFHFWHPEGLDMTPPGRIWYRLWVGVGDASKTQFTAPLRDSVADATRKVYVGGVLKTLTTDYTVTNRGATNTLTDRINFVTAPAAGAVVEMTGYGILIVKAITTADLRALVNSALRYHGMSLDIQEVL